MRRGGASRHKRHFNRICTPSTLMMLSMILNVILWIWGIEVAAGPLMYCVAQHQGGKDRGTGDACVRHITACCAAHAVEQVRHTA
jgi:hypothetical protein